MDTMRYIVTALAFLLASGSGALAQTFSDDAWRANEETYREILRHSFLTQMQDGTLDQDVFAEYLVQDAHFLGVYGRALQALADKAPRPEWARRLGDDAQSSLAEERHLQELIFETYGIEREQIAKTDPSPDALGYANYVLATVHDRPFAEGLAAVLPCYWIYWEVGKSLVQAGSPDPTYQTWIDSYASDEYGQSVGTVLEIINVVAAASDAATIARMQKHYARGSLYEWLFWDSAFHRRGWPLDVGPRHAVSDSGR